MTPFADRLSDAVAKRQSNLCLGLDPGPDVFPDLSAWARALIERCGEHCVAVKPQLACFERHGADGWAALEEIAVDAKAAGLLVLADGKRGDVPHTAKIYAEAMAGLGADAFTANPLAGGDSLDALIEGAAENGAGIFVLVRTSNPGAADFFDLATDAGTLADVIAAKVAERAGALAGTSGLSGLGAVVGATAPEHLRRLRRALPDSIFLIPGVGAQGGQPQDMGPAVGSGPASVLFPVSRAISAAPDAGEAAARLRDELWAHTS